MSRSRMRLNPCHSPWHEISHTIKNPDIRKAAYEAELKAYEKVDDSLAACLSNIKGEVITLCKWRGYESALEETLLKSRITKKIIRCDARCHRRSPTSFS